MKRAPTAQVLSLDKPQETECHPVTVLGILLNSGPL